MGSKMEPDLLHPRPGVSRWAGLESVDTVGFMLCGWDVQWVLTLVSATDWPR